MVKHFGWGVAGLALVVVILDGLTKFFFWQQLVAGNTQFWRWQFLHFTGQLNWGVAFSLPLTGSWLALVLAIALPVLAWFVYYHLQHDSWQALVVASFLIGGAVGNLLTRFLLGGAVLDFIGIGLFPLFNLADSAITLGALMLVLFWPRIVR